MIYKDLQRLAALFDMVKKMGDLRLQDFLDSVTRNTAEIMGVKACSIKLLDADRKRLRFASTYGLSVDYVSKGYISIDKSGVNRQVIDGTLYSIGEIDEARFFQYPEDVGREGIVSMLCLPLRAEGKTFGVLSVYSGEANYFKEVDVAFFSLMTDLISTAIERINLEMAKTWFMNKVAHQLRSPLHTIQSMLFVMAGDYLGTLNDEQRETVTRCQKRLAILQSTVNDLLKLAAGREEIAPPRLDPVDAAAILRGLEPLYRAQALEKGVSLEFCVPDGLRPVLGQEGLIDDLFSNLISNAIKYTPPGGRVTVSLLNSSPDEVLFEALDTGIGISEGDQSRLFSEFFRAENAKSMVEEGTGLGLVIVGDVVERMGGTIRVESKIGQGTRMSCRLPAKPEGDRVT